MAAVGNFEVMSNKCNADIMCTSFISSSKIVHWWWWWWWWWY